MKLGGSKFITLYIWGIVIFFTGLYLSLIFSPNIWTDEAFTLQLLKGNIIEIINGTARDVHPPLYYLYAKIFYVLFNGSLIAQKIATIIPMTATLIFGATVIRKHFGDLTSVLFLLFITCLPCTMEFSVQVRMYSLALLCVTVCGVYAYLAFQDGRKRNFVIFALSGVSAAYLHYFAAINIILITGFLMLAILLWRKEHYLKWSITAAGMILLYLPWSYFFIKQIMAVTNEYWIPEITGDTVWTYFTWLFDLNVVPGMVFIFLILLIGASHYNTILISKNKSEHDIYALACMIVPILTAITGVFLSWLKTPIYRDQYIFPALGLLALFFGITLQNAKRSIIMIICAFLLFVGAGQYKESFIQEYHSTNVPQTLAFFEENLHEDDYILFNSEPFGFIYECYFPEEQLIFMDDFDFSSDFRAVWVLNTYSLPGVDQETLIEHDLYMDEIEGEFGIEHNLFDIYKIYRQ